MGSMGDWRFGDWIEEISNRLVSIMVYGALMVVLALYGRLGLISILGWWRTNAAHSIIIILKAMLYLNAICASFKKTTLFMAILLGMIDFHN